MRLLVILSFLALSSSCTESIEIADPGKSGYAYYPLADDRSWTYERRYVSGMDTLGEQVRILVRESGTNNEGSVTYILDRYSRPSSQAEWMYERTLSTWRNDLQAVQNLSNRRTLEMVFPVVSGKEWDYNSANNSQELRVEYRNEGTSFMEWFPTVTVATSSLVGVQWEKVYAENIGMVYMLNTTVFEEWKLLEYE